MCVTIFKEISITGRGNSYNGHRVVTIIKGSDSAFFLFFLFFVPPPTSFLLFVFFLAPDVRNQMPPPVHVGFNMRRTVGSVTLRTLRALSSP